MYVIRLELSPSCMLHVPHDILSDSTTLTIFGEAYALWSSSLCSLLQSYATSSLLSPNNVSFFLCLCLPNSLLPSRFPAKFLFMYFSCLLYVKHTRPSYHPWFDDKIRYLHLLPLEVKYSTAFCYSQQWLSCLLKTIKCRCTYLF